MNDKEIYKASVVIPVLNGGSLLVEVIDKVLAQETPWPFEVLIIDSGSTDETVRHCERLVQVRLHCISPREFGHGRTRNLGASLTTGEFIVFLTQDALPASNTWLLELVSTADLHPNVAGAFGRHIAYPSASVFTKRDLQNHFDGFLEWPQVVSLTDHARYEVDTGYRGMLRFFSDNNSCVRRSVWEKIPYPDVDFGEDQVWAKQVVEAGYAKAFANNAVVYHSHDYGIIEQFRRSFDEARFFCREFSEQPWGGLGKVGCRFLVDVYMDTKYLWSLGSVESKLYWLFRQPVISFSKAVGLFVGGHERYLPSSILHHFSRDKSLNKYSTAGSKKRAARASGVSMWKRLFRRKVRSKITPPMVGKKKDVVKFYSFVDYVPHGKPFAEIQDKEALRSTINWVVPGFGEGSGGHLNIFRMIYNLEKQGFTCRVYIVGQTKYQNGSAARSDIHKFFFPIEADVDIGIFSMRPAWFTFATSWTTAYPVRNFQSTKEKLYFVQDFEPYFYPHGAEYAFAEQTYRLGFKGVTAGGWLAQKLSTQYGMDCVDFSFSYDKELYRPGEGSETGTRHIFFYARPPTSRRGFELGLKVLDRVVRAVPNTAVVFAGWDVSGYKIDYPHLNAGVVRIDNLSELYRHCEVALVLSFTNASLLPLELMASGCPVVSNAGENVEWLLDSENACLCDATVEGLASGLIGLLTNEPLRMRLRANGLKFAQDTDWAREAAAIGRHLQNL